MRKKIALRKLEESWARGAERAAEDKARKIELEEARFQDAAGLVVKTAVRGGTTYACTWTCSCDCQ
ncbi:MAG TPA: hypothetical protein VFD70_10830 [Anaerolineae bacterium]|nr:hypothetical protein [Anaerolineae bacterium]